MHNVQSAPDCDDRTPDYHVYHDPSGTAKISTTITHTLADVMGIDVTDARVALYDSVDPESLDRIFTRVADSRSRPPAHVAFTVDGCQVTVYSTGEIILTPPPSPPKLQGQT